MHNTMVDSMFNFDEVLFNYTAESAEVSQLSFDKLSCFAHYCIRPHHYNVYQVVYCIFEEVSRSLLKFF